MDFDPRLLFFTPAELSTLSVQYYDWISASPGMNWGISAVDRDMLPWRSGTVVGLIARPGHGKTTLAAAKARITAEQIVAEGKQDEECVLYVALDQAVEEIEALFMAGQGFSATEYMRTTLERDRVVERALQRPRLPIYVMGRSVTKRRRTPRLTIDRLYDGIGAMESSFGVKPRLIIVDYLQIVPVERAKERVEQVGEVVVRGGELALSVGSCMLFLAQASQTVDGREDKIPTIADCQWSSALGQEADVILAANRPWLSNRRGGVGAPTRVEVRGTQYDITPDLFLLRAEKQRFESAGMTFVLTLDPQYVELSDRELHGASFTGTQGSLSV